MTGTGGGISLPSPPLTASAIPENQAWCLQKRCEVLSQPAAAPGMGGGEGARGLRLLAPPKRNAAQPPPQMV